jgi:hypothetical protein
MEKVKINFIITCFNKEEYWPHLKKLIESYKTIDPIICLAYNGNDDSFKCDVRIPNKGLQEGEFSLIKAGYQHLIDNDTPSDLFVKLSVDSWLCNEDIINRIFSHLNHFRVPYAGNYWHERTYLSTDIFFCNLAYGNVFEAFEFDAIALEKCMFNTIDKLGGRFYLINEREPVHPEHRNSCKILGWTMDHDLDTNIDFLKNYMQNKPKVDIENAYAVCCNRPSDINALLPTLNRYAKECNHITEMGVREVVSTWAFLAASPKKMISYDLFTSPNINAAIELANSAGIDFTFFEQDVIKEGFEIEETDLLFIDTWHSYDQLKKELNKHGNKARKYLAFHDTESFGYKDEEESDFKKQPQGLIKAIDDFLLENPHWEICEKILINNGLTILKRKR